MNSVCQSTWLRCNRDSDILKCHSVLSSQSRYNTLVESVFVFVPKRFLKHSRKKIEFIQCESSMRRCRCWSQRGDLQTLLLILLNWCWYTYWWVWHVSRPVSASMHVENFYGCASCRFSCHPRQESFWNWRKFHLRAKLFQVVRKIMATNCSPIKEVHGVHPNLVWDIGMLA